jgi:hypothetical protein
VGQFNWRLVGRWAVRVLALGFMAGLLALTVAVTSRDDATNMETALWTFILFAVGAGISYYFGQRSIKEGADELVRPQARAAARRLVTLGRGLQSLGALINLSRVAARRSAEDHSGSVPMSHVDFAYDALLIQLDAQAQTVIDALEDWREFEPEIVNELETRQDNDE